MRHLGLVMAVRHGSPFWGRDGAGLWWVQLEELWPSQPEFLLGASGVHAGAPTPFGRVHHMLLAALPAAARERLHPTLTLAPWSTLIPAWASVHHGEFSCLLDKEGSRKRASPSPLTPIFVYPVKTGHNLAA